MVPQKREPFKVVLLFLFFFCAFSGEFFYLQKIVQGQKIVMKEEKIIVMMVNKKYEKEIWVLGMKVPKVL